MNFAQANSDLNKNFYARFFIYFRKIEHIPGELSFKINLSISQKLAHPTKYCTVHMNNWG
jgi:hypothetical protein